MTDRTKPTAKTSDAERPSVAANEDATEPFTVADLLAYHEAHPQPRK